MIVLDDDIIIKTDFQSVKFSEWAEFLFFARENVALKLNSYLRLRNLLLFKFCPLRKSL